MYLVLPLCVLVRTKQESRNSQADVKTQHPYCFRQACELVNPEDGKPNFGRSWIEAVLLPQQQQMRHRLIVTNQGNFDNAKQAASCTRGILVG